MRAETDGVEFLPGDGALAAAQDDVVELRPRRVPRWVLVLSGLLVVVAIAGAVVTHRHGSKPATARPTARVSVSVAPRPAADAPTPVGAREALGQPMAVGPWPAYDIQAAPGALYILQLGHLEKYVPGAIVIVDLHGLTSAANAAGRLVLDLAAGRVWAVVEGPASGRILEFDAQTLKLLRDLTWTQPPVNAATALGGHLYLGTDHGLADLAPDAAQPHFVAGIDGAVGAVSVAGAPARVIVFGRGSRTRTWVYGPARAAAPHSLPFGEASVAVTVNGVVWVGGFGDRSAALTSLDPSTLAPGKASGAAAKIGPGAVVVAGGQDVIWVRRDVNSRALWCVDALTGRQLDYWPNVAGRVASRKGDGYLIDPTQVVHPLFLGNCTG